MSVKANDKINKNLSRFHFLTVQIDTWNQTHWVNKENHMNIQYHTDVFAIKD